MRYILDPKAKNEVQFFGKDRVVINSSLRPELHPILLQFVFGTPEERREMIRAGKEHIRNESKNA